MDGAEITRLLQVERESDFYRKHKEDLKKITAIVKVQDLQPEWLKKYLKERK